MAERLQQFLSHLKPGGSALATLSQKHPDDVVITLAIRTPLTKASKGGLKDTALEHMLLRLYQVQSPFCKKS
jgi:acetyl-CoA acyltransferase 1